MQNTFLLYKTFVKVYVRKVNIFLYTRKKVYALPEFFFSFIGRSSKECTEDNLVCTYNNSKSAGIALDIITSLGTLTCKMPTRED